MRLRSLVNPDWLRTVQWLVIGLALYALTFGAGLQDSAPGLQSTIYNLANITLRAWVAYWVSRSLLGPLDDISPYERESVGKSIVAGSRIIGRALIVLAVILTSR